MKTWISVLTCDKRGVSYLEHTLTSLELGGADLCDEQLIHVDGPAPAISYGDWDVVSVSDVAGGGARLAMQSVLRRAHAAGVDLLLYFEDDVIVCRNAIAAMLEIGVPEPLGFVSYCDLLHHTVAPLTLRAFPGCPRGAHVVERGFLGCQALAIPRRTIERLCALPVPPFVDANACDAFMGTSSETYGIVDSLAQHAGQESAIVGGPYVGPAWRQARGFPGESFDAAALPRRWELNAVGERCMFHAGVLHESERPCAQQTDDHVRRMAGL